MTAGADFDCPLSLPQSLIRH